MTPRRLLEALGFSGISITAEPDALRYRAPVGHLTPELMRELKAHKAELVELLVRRCPFCKKKVGTVTHPLVIEDLFYLDTECRSCGELIECSVRGRNQRPYEPEPFRTSGI